MNTEERSQEWLNGMSKLVDECGVGLTTPSQKYTPLEKILVNIVIKNMLTHVESPEDLHRSVCEVDKNISAYIDTLSKCEEARLANTRYSVEQIVNEQTRIKEQNRLRNLYNAQLIRQTGTRQSKNDAFKFFDLYETLEEGTRLLYEHKNARKNK